MLSHHHIFYHHLLQSHHTSLPFWETFFTELLVGLIILIIGSFAVPKYLDWRKKPHLLIINPLTRNDRFYLTRASNNFWEATLQLVIKNKTAVSQREWFWHIIIPHELNPQFQSLDQDTTSQHNEIVVNGKKFAHYFGSAKPKEVIFPKRTLRFNYEIKVMTSEKTAKNYQIYYYFNTEFGTWPRKAEEIEQIALNPKLNPEIAFGSEYLGNITLTPEK